ncbi:hypothetical protein EC515_07710 [Helicobacter pylori]|nr:hypothetical protein ECC47_07520 [Helicobacter pylori]RVY95827.1 hypothetical protein EC515_07710 [Helicobacter pylori]
MFFLCLNFAFGVFGGSELIMNAFGFENSVPIKYWCLKPYFYSFKFYSYSEIHEKIGGYFAIL